MPQKTNTELIRELTLAVRAVETRVDYVERDLDTVETDNKDKTQVYTGFAKDLATLTERVAELKRVSEETDRKRWQLTLAVIAALIAFVLSLVANLILLIIRR